jgi:CubicO group peptidase (beta-lactamase class C family)
MPAILLVLKRLAIKIQALMNSLSAEEHFMRAMRLRRIVGHCATTVLLLPFLSRAQLKTELPHPKTLEDLQAAMKHVLDEEHVPGAGVALIVNGEVLWCGGIGKADVAANRGAGCDTEFRVGSISKTFVALALLKLQEEGKINLYARLQDVAPGVPFKNPWESTHPVRVVNLLEHTAGFDDMEFSEIYNLRNRYDFPLFDVFKRFQKPDAARWPPGTRTSYSNPGYGIAGYLIEKVSGKPFDKYIRDDFLRPLGMDNADFPFTDAIKPLLATGYGGNPPHAVGYPFIYLRPAGDLKASPGELAKLVQFLLRRGRAGDTQLLKPESILRMEAPETTLAAKTGLRLGYGLANYTQVTGSVVTHGHNGGIDGFLSTYRYMPEQNWGYVILLNSTNSGRALLDLNRLAIDFLSKDFPKTQQPLISLPASALEKLSGYYAPRAPRDQLFAFADDLTGGLRVRVLNGQLTRSSLFGKPELLLPVAKNLFRGAEEPEGTTIFFTGEDGRMAVTSSGLSSIPYAERSSLLWVFTKIALLLLCAFLMATSLLFALIWVPRKLFGGMQGVGHLWVRATPVLASLSLAAVILCVTQFGGTHIGTFNVWSAGVFLGTLLFPLFSLAGLILALLVPESEIHRAVRIHSLLVSGACCLLSGFFASWGLLALRTWAE